MGSRRICALTVTAFGLVCVTAGRGDAREFDFKDPKDVNAMTFVLDTPIEPIVGLASGVSGKVTFDPDRPEQISGRLVVAANTLHVPNPKMNEHLHSAEWLDVAKYTEISFVFKAVRQAKKVGEDAFDLDVEGDFTCRGVTKPLRLPVKVSSLPGKFNQRMHRGDGDLLVLRAEFAIKRTDFGIKPDVPAAALDDVIQLRAGIVGVWEKK